MEASFQPWFNHTKGLEKLGELEEGDLIQFDARVKPCWKGYMCGREEVYKPVEKDYKLSHPTKISLLDNPNKQKRPPLGGL